MAYMKGRKTKKQVAQAKALKNARASSKGIQIKGGGTVKPKSRTVKSAAKLMKAPKRTIKTGGAKRSAVAKSKALAKTAGSRTSKIALKANSMVNKMTGSRTSLLKKKSSMTSWSAKKKAAMQKLWNRNKK